MSKAPMRISLLSVVRLPMLAMLCIGVAGCANGTGAVFQKVFGPPEVAAKYKPPKEDTLVLVENYRNPAMTEFDADRIARTVAAELKENDVAPMVDIDEVTALREADPTKFRAMTIPAVGQAVGAKQVIYVDLINSNVEGDTSRGVVRGKAEARVRVVEVATGHTLWPEDQQQGVPVGCEVPYAQADQDNAATEVHNALLDDLSKQIARLFHKWKPETAAEGDAAG
jgi:hypothetical protein